MYVRNKFTQSANFDFNSFFKDVQTAVIGLNEILDEGMPYHPLKEQSDTARDLRQIGLGIMGYGDMLIMLGLEYGTQEAIDFTEKIAETLSNSALQQSAILAKEFGVFPRYKEEHILKSKYLKAVANKDTLEMIAKFGLRNSQILTSAPTGSLSTMWGITGGIEPIYQISYSRKTETLNNGGETFYRVFTPIAREYMQLNNIKDEKDLPYFFKTAMTLDWRKRIDTQSIWQKYIDASISSTVNLHENVSIEEIKQLYIYAWKKKLKGITVFRDGCERAGILSSNHTQQKETKDMSIDELQDLLSQKVVEKLLANPNVCPMCEGEFVHVGGCSECLDCGYSPCSI